MLRFSQASLLTNHLRRVEPLAHQERTPPGSVLHYVLIEQVAQHVTVFTKKDPNCGGYVKSVLRQNPTSQEEGGPAPQRYLVEFRHLQQKAKTLRTAVMLHRTPKSGACLGVWDGRKQRQQVRLKEYPGSIAEFEEAPVAQLPAQRSRVLGQTWRAVSRCLKNFMKPDANPDVFAQSNQPLILINQGLELTLMGFHKGQNQIFMTCTLPVTEPLAPEPFLMPLSAKLIDRFTWAGGDTVEVGYDPLNRQLGISSEDYECTTVRQEASFFIDRFLGDHFWGNLQSVAKRHVQAIEAEAMVRACQPEAIEGRSICLVEQEGELHMFPERNIQGDNYALIGIQPHPENQGVWQPVVIVHEYLHAAWMGILHMILQMKIPVDLRPLSTIELLKFKDQWFLRLELSLPSVTCRVYQMVMPAERVIDSLDYQE